MKTALITGATSGIGLSTTQLFLKRGYRVVMVDLDDVLGQMIKKELDETGYEGKVFFKQGDVSSSKSMEALYNYTKIFVGQIDVIINNAGIFCPGELHEVSEEMWDLVMSVDVKGIYLTTKYFVPDMIQRRAGVILNTASISGLQGDYNMAAYNAAKGAVVNLARAMALDYGKYGIRVNNVCPGPCMTPMFERNPDELVREFEQASPVGRICTPEEVAQALYFLAGDEAQACTGINLPVTTGFGLHTGQPIQDKG